MTRIRTHSRYTGPGIWSGIRDGLRWLLRLPLRLLHRRDRQQLRAAMEQLSPKLLSAEASIYWIYPPGAPRERSGLRPDRGLRVERRASSVALGGMREPTTAVLASLAPTLRYLVLNLRESDSPTNYELPDREHFRAIRFPITSGTLSAREAVLHLFDKLVAFIEEEAAAPPALLFHCKEGISRTPQMLCAWLVWREGLALEDAVARVQTAQRDAWVFVFVPDGRERGWIRGFAE
jgi:hypothetical protein